MNMFEYTWYQMFHPNPAKKFSIIDPENDEVVAFYKELEVAVDASPQSRIYIFVQHLHKTTQKVTKTC